jgi:hypothetical protein
MNKEKFLGIRRIEKEAHDYYHTGDLIGKFLKDNEEYLLDLTDEKSKNAIERLKKYRKILYSKARSLNSLADDEFEKYREECHHEIVFKDDREGYGQDTHAYYCPLCREYLCTDEAMDGSLVIGVQAIYGCECPSQGDASYKAIDYLIENDCDLTEEEFFHALASSYPGRICRQVKDGYKVRIKK